MIMPEQNREEICRIVIPGDQVAARDPFARLIFAIGSAGRG
ncbi:hypothetical protein KEK_21649 [Mycolicibacterium thermoresistibile ATCC 19527]|jgi:hypothetical protein|uniref:Uncharacterized protein n=1 Tax=Mycolicibacterium thermoresistibile (strain ATCC 19527 / DSM 44167 / CIP 105390 / JCM 6362 / NCTC 10409 / 316) TaxID=1078020 RepID=G7CMT2_MYCT3|nr:hypothetical protein KEK_21649 [Mycolicibacterium thermoresistibile ATCC 19527]